jgi:nitroreductase
VTLSRLHLLRANAELGVLVLRPELIDRLRQAPLGCTNGVPVFIAHVGRHRTLLCQQRKYNLQPWRFVVVRNPEQKRRLREAAMGQAKVEEAGAVIVCCGDPNAPRGRNLDEVLAEAAKHGFSEEQNRKVKEAISSGFGKPAGNAMGVAPEWAVWINRHVMIALTTMMWMAEVLGYDTAPMEGFSEDKVKAVLNIPDSIRVVALLGIGRLKGPDKRYAGRHELRDVCFADKWYVSVLARLTLEACAVGFNSTYSRRSERFYGDALWESVRAARSLIRGLHDRNRGNALVLVRTMSARLRTLVLPIHP